MKRILIILYILLLVGFTEFHAQFFKKIGGFTTSAQYILDPLTGDTLYGVRCLDVNCDSAMMYINGDSLQIGGTLGGGGGGEPLFLASVAYGISAGDTSNYREAYDSLHEHGNKNILDAITAAFTAEQANAIIANTGKDTTGIYHNNRGVLNGISAVDTLAYRSAVDSLHNHPNKGLLDVIDAGDTIRWGGVSGNPILADVDEADTTRWSTSGIDTTSLSNRIDNVDGRVDSLNTTVAAGITAQDTASWNTASAGSGLSQAQIESTEFTNISSSQFELVGASVGNKGVYLVDGVLTETNYDTVLIFDSNDTLINVIHMGDSSWFVFQNAGTYDTMTVFKKGHDYGAAATDYPIKYSMQGTNVTLDIVTINVPVQFTNGTNDYFVTLVTTGEVTMQGDTLQPPSGTFEISTSGTYVSAGGVTDAMTFRLRKNGVDVNYPQSGLRGQIYRWVVSANGTDWFSLWVENDSGTGDVSVTNFMMSVTEQQNLQ